MNSSALLIAFLVAAGSTIGVCPWLTVALQRRNVVDHSTERSSHEGAVPRGGGLAILIGMGVALLASMTYWIEHPHVVAALATAGGFAVLGLADDIQALPVRTRMLWQIGFALLFVPVLRSSDLMVVGGLGLIVVAVWIIGFVNTFNFMDGINGISAVNTAVLGASLAVSSIRWGGNVELPAVALVGAALGFLPFNAPRARIFLGDVGSYLIGSLLALMAAVAVGNGVPLLAVMLPFGVYGADVTTTLLRRARRHERLALSHREHAYQLLAIQGWGHAKTTAVVAGLTAALAVAGQLAPLSAAAAIGALLASGTLVLYYLSLPEYP